MVCLLSVGSFIGDMASGSPRDLQPLGSPKFRLPPVPYATPSVPDAAASAVIPHLRLCAACPRNPRRSLSFKHTAFAFPITLRFQKGQP